MNENRQLLEPICTMCTLIGLNFKMKHTKLQFNNHTLSLHEPTNYQFIVRTVSGDGRENISELYDVIIRLIAWFMIENNEMKNNSSFTKLVAYLQLALGKLQHTYKTGNVVITLAYYINLLSDALNNKFDHLYALPIPERKDDLLNYEPMKKFWNMDDVELICKHYTEAFKIMSHIENNKLGALRLKVKYEEINGHVSSVERVVDVMNEAFIVLVENSDKG